MALFRGFDFEVCLRARKVSGSFEKRAVGAHVCVRGPCTRAPSPPPNYSAVLEKASVHISAQQIRTQAPCPVTKCKRDLSILYCLQCNFHGRVSSPCFSFVHSRVHRSNETLYRQQETVLNLCFV